MSGDIPETEEAAAYKRRRVIWLRAMYGSIEGCVIWAGETFFAVLPLLTYYLVKYNSDHVFYKALCNKNMTHCLFEPKAPLSEMNMIGVIISGLGILSLIEFRKAKPRIIETNMFIYIIGFILLGLLIVGSVLYTLQAASVARHSQILTENVLGMSLVLSLFLTVVRGWQNAIANHNASS